MHEGNYVTACTLYRSEIKFLSVVVKISISIYKDVHMNIDHIDAYYEALSKKDKKKILPHLANDIVLYDSISSILTIGQEATIDLLSEVFEVIDNLNLSVRFTWDRDVAVFFSFTHQGAFIEGNEYLHLNDQGLIDRMEVFWRPFLRSACTQKF